MKILFLNSHPIQYKVPLYQEAAKHLDIEVIYCSDESVKGKVDKEFGVKVKWDIPLLDGYKSFFIRNYSPKASIHNGFWGLVNPGVIKVLWRRNSGILVVHGWGYFTNVISIIFGKLLGHKVCIRAETPLHQELMKNKYITILKHWYLRILFLFVDKFLYIGSQNKDFYRYLKVSENDLLFTPYAVDNKRFQTSAESISKKEARAYLKLDHDKLVVLYSGKYINKKRPLDLLKAFYELNNGNSVLIMMGEGELRPEMELFIKEHQLERKVLLTGFINQTEIMYYYKSADVFVMCSGLGETWGLSVNEAMNFSLPIIVSETTGCSYDLVQQGNNGNGYVFETGNISHLTDCLRQVLEDGERRTYMGKRSLEIISHYSNIAIISSLLELSKN